MKKTLLVSAVLLTLVAVLGITGYAFAQTPTPPNGYPGMMGGYGHMGGMMNGAGGMMDADGNYGPMHEYMLKALAAKLNLTPEELQARLEKGETMWQVAQSQGLSDEQIASLMTEAHNQAIKEAVATGVITQEQADFMNNHMQQMHGSGGCHGAPQNDSDGTSTNTNL
jgi:hypothetical protein